MNQARGPIGAENADDANCDMAPNARDDADQEASPAIDPSLMDEASALIDNARIYAEAELGFQKTRAAFAGRLIGVAIGLGIVAIILLHIAFLALAVGLVLAFEPLVGIWGAIAVVFGGLLLVVALLGWGAFGRVQKLASLFGSSGDEGADA